VWGRLVLDEAQMAKNPTTNTHIHLRDMVKAEATWNVSATPADNKERDLWSLARLAQVDEDLARDTASIVRHFVHRVDRRSIKGSLPEIEFRYVDVELNDPTKRMIEALRDMHINPETGKAAGAGTAIAKMTTLRILAAEPMSVFDADSATAKALVRRCAGTVTKQMVQDAGAHFHLKPAALECSSRFLVEAQRNAEEALAAIAKAPHRGSSSGSSSSSSTDAVRAHVEDVLSAVMGVAGRVDVSQASVSRLAELRQMERGLVVAAIPAFHPDDRVLKCAINAYKHAAEAGRVLRSATERSGAKRVYRSPKTVAAMGIIRRTLGNGPGEKVLVFTHFTAEIEQLRNALNDDGVYFKELCGNMTDDDRSSGIELFVARADVRVLIINISCGGQGLNLQVARTVILMSGDWNPSLEMQAVARSHRTGQTSKVFVYALVSKTDSERRVMSVQQRKLHLVCDKLFSDDDAYNEKKSILEEWSF
jgi:SNF2 family DNA or RNA helicase